jgi:8-oxo-dGTP pyrophosphatase MutT (NUDIX family)
MSDAWEEDGNPWVVTAQKRGFENDWFVIDEHEAINPAGKPARYDVIRPRRLAVGVVPLEADGSVHLIGQWRFPLKRYSWEIPEGGAEFGEDAESGVRRELAEEAGVSAGRLVKILEMDLSNSLTDESCVLFLATDLSPAAGEPDDVEVLRRRTAPFGEVLARIQDGRIRDSLTVAAMLRVHHMAVMGELPPDLAKAVLK